MAIPPGYLKFDGFKWVVEEEVSASDVDAVVFDGGNTSKNIRSDRVDTQSPIDNTKNGIVDLGSDTVGTSTGVASNYSAILGGDQNNVTADFSLITGGLQNTIVPDTFSGHTGANYSTIVGGRNNSVISALSFIGGGNNNTITGGEGNSSPEGNYILGGFNNSILLGASCNILGGYTNLIGGSEVSTRGSAIGGGANNSIQPGASSSFIGGGYSNSIGASSSNSTIGGGSGNFITTTSGTIGGGNSNQVNGQFGCVPGGISNTAQGAYSFACGIAANAARLSQWTYSGSGVFSVVGDNPQYSKFFVKGQTSGATPLILSADQITPVSLNLQNGVAYMIRAHCLANRVGVANRAMFINTLLAHCTSSTATIDSNTATLAVANGTAWTIAYTTSGANIIATFTGTSGQTVKATVYYEFVEIPGGV